MGLQYNILMEDVTVSAASTLVFIAPSAAVGFAVLRAWASQAGSATSAQVKIQLGRKAAGFPTSLTSVTPKKLHERYPVSVFVGNATGAAGKCGVNSSTEGAGAFDPTYQDAFNNLNGWLWTPVFERDFVFVAGSTEACILRFPATPSPTGNWSAGLCIEEL